MVVNFVVSLSCIRDFCCQLQTFPLPNGWESSCILRLVFQ
ncbi:hypothetical protein AHF37_07667 [Paragonimus kellicotti]|nr:hypothetical protein AHF37_07667 [Paragonimus kellicotti]